jgi:uncharacterized linocin/CFP29 family protein
MNNGSNWAMTAQQRSALGWTDEIWTDIDNAVTAELKRARTLRSAFPLFGDHDTNPDAIVDYTVTPGSPSLINPSLPRLLAVELSKQFTIFKDQQWGDAGVAIALAVNTAHDVAKAEEAVFELGSDAEPNLRALNVQERNLHFQSSRLSAPDAPQVRDSVLESILDGMAQLQARGHEGDYLFIGAPDVYARAFRIPVGRADADIVSILPLLSKDGFRYSQGAPRGTATLASLGGGTIYVSIPCDTTIGFVKEDRDFVLEVKERARLLINDVTAVQQLD